jgi:hypothetical protein
MDLLGQKISLDKKGAGLELPKGEFEKNLPALDVNLDIPLYPLVYAKAGLTITPTLKFTFSGVKAGLTSNIFSMSDVGITGEMGLDITAKVGAGVGLANVVGLEAGAFVGLGGAANLSGMLGGEVNFKDKTSTVKLDLNGSAAITGEVGVFGRAKLLGAALEKQITIANREFAIYEYTRNGEYSNGWSHLMPKVGDFHRKYNKKEGPFNLEINYATTGLA